MAISRDETAIERNTRLFAELDSMTLNEQVIYYSEEHRIQDYLRAIRERYVSSINSKQEQTNDDFPFRITMCTGAMIVMKIK